MTVAAPRAPGRIATWSGALGIAAVLGFFGAVLPIANVFTAVFAEVADTETIAVGEFAVSPPLGSTIDEQSRLDADPPYVLLRGGYGIVELTTAPGTSIEAVLDDYVARIVPDASMPAVVRAEGTTTGELAYTSAFAPGTGEDIGIWVVEGAESSLVIVASATPGTLSDAYGVITMVGTVELAGS